MTFRREFKNTEARNFQDRLIEEAVGIREVQFPRKEKETISLTLFDQVLNPTYSQASLLLANNIGVDEGDEVLDMFTGSGVQAICAAKEGARSVTAVDVYQNAVACAKYNVMRNNVQEIVRVLQGDLFEPLKKERKFDLIVANPPFSPGDAISAIERAVRDPDYKTLQRFFQQSKSILRPHGKMRVVFADVGDMEYFEQLARETQWEYTIRDETLYKGIVRIRVYECR